MFKIVVIEFTPIVYDVENKRLVNPKKLHQLINCLNNQNIDVAILNQRNDVNIVDALASNSSLPPVELLRVVQLFEQDGNENTQNPSRGVKSLDFLLNAYKEKDKYTKITKQDICFVSAANSSELKDAGYSVFQCNCHAEGQKPSNFINEGVFNSIYEHVTGEKQVLNFGNFPQILLAPTDDMMNLLGESDDLRQLPGYCNLL